MEKVEDIDIGTYSIYAGKGAPLILTYALDTMMNPADHQLTDTLTCQWYCYELERDANGKTIGSVDKADCLKAVQGIYEPQVRDTIMWKSDAPIGEAFELKVADLNPIDGVVVVDNDFLPEKDGYYFCIITNKYNDNETKISTPLAYYDNQNDA